jgi:UDP-3-O-[3-hydroxymyristoyl] glucosamine N-acyltransferase
VFLSEIAKLLGVAFTGSDPVITGVSTVEEAASTDITFLSNPHYTEKAKATKAGAIIVKQKLDINIPQIVVDNPSIAFAKVVRAVCPVKTHNPGISELAYKDPSADISATATVYPYAYVGKNARIEGGCVLYPGCFIGDDAIIREGTILYPNVAVYDKCEVGKNCIIHAGVVIGSDGFGFAWDGKQHLKIPQVGKVIIGDDVEIGSNCCIDRAALTSTRIGSDVKMDNLVQIGHNVTIGDHTIIVSQVGIAGSAHVGKHVILAGQAGVAGHITIGDGCVVGGKAGVAEDIEPGKVVSGYPTMDHKLWLRAQNAFKKLPDLLKRIRDIERRLEKIEKD